jgi:hypothetical protein
MQGDLGMNEFFVGYLARVPAGMLRFLKRTIFGAAFGTALLASVIGGSQHRFPASVFEYNQVRNFEGTVE